jgi:hypothetical protein
MDRLPDALFLIDVKKEHIAVKEAKRLGIPVVAIVDTNCDPDDVTHVIPGNDDALRAIRLFCEKVGDAVQEGVRRWRSRPGPGRQGGGEGGGLRGEAGRPARLHLPGDRGRGRGGAEARAAGRPRDLSAGTRRTPQHTRTMTETNTVEITAEMVRRLREKTGVGMMDCKKALNESKGDEARALDLLRQRGLASARAKEARATKDGVIGTYVHAGARSPSWSR